MTLRRFATVAALAIAGLAAAVGIGLLANSISGDSVGLGAEPLSAGETLAPASVQKAEERRQKRHRTRNRNRGGDETRTTTSGTLTNQIAPAEPGDDNGGDRVSTDDNSGSGSTSSGSTPGGSGSSGSGSSGSGSGSGSSGGSGDD
jgi:uncharacterized membrane protein YgcG